MQIDRRAAFMVPVGIFFASFMQGCSSVSGVVNSLPQWAQDAQTIGSALGTVASTLSTITGLPAAVVAKVQGAVVTVQSLASQLASVASTSASTTGSGIAGIVTNFGGAVSSALTSIAGVSVPSWVQTALSAVSTLLPTILSIAGVALAGPSDPRAVDASRAYLLALVA